MRSRIVWIIACLCGLIAFGSTLVGRAPRVPIESDEPPQTHTRFHSFADGSSMPWSLAGMEEFVSARADTLSPEQAMNAWRWLARRRAWAGQDDASREAWKEAARLASQWLEPQIHPGNPLRPTFVLAEALWALGEREKALERYAEAIDSIKERTSGRSPEPIYLFYKAWSERRLGRDEDARRDFSHAADALSQGIEGQLDMGRVYAYAASCALSGDRERAVAGVTEAIRRQWRDTETLTHGEEFESVRDDPKVRALIAELATGAEGEPDRPSPEPER